MKKTNRIVRPLICLVAIVLIVGIGCTAYLSDYYHADTSVIDMYTRESNIVSHQFDKNATAYMPENPSAAFIFYPGGKVEHTAYEPLMIGCAERGILCILVEMPGNLAVLDINAADDLFHQFPDIENWYIGGHSLGGSMAASYAAENSDKLKGLILLAAYSTENLTSTSLDVLSVYGSEDHVLNAEKYKKYRVNLSETFSEIIIDGGCHAGFGMYGSQNGDGIPTISSDEQILIAAEKISEFILDNK